MLRINVIASAASAERYYFERADYYLDVDGLPARWHGRAAEQLGLRGDVGYEQFAALFRNQHPHTGERLTAAMRANRRVGYDFTFTAPKSVSLLATLAGDDRLIDAFRNSVNETMQAIEQDAAVRVRKNGEDKDRISANLAWADIIHMLARPTGEDGVPQPALHAHVVLANASFDQEEAIWKALQAGGLKSAAPYYQAVFRAKLAEHIQHLGYQLQVKKGDFEIRGVPETAIGKLSERTREIEALARKLGVMRPEAKAKLGRTSRRSKNRKYTWQQLKDKWHATLTHEEIKAVHATFEAAYAGSSKFQSDSAPAFQLALDHLLERQSAVPERTLVAEALSRGLGQVTLEGLEAQLLRTDIRRGAYDGVTMVTTRQVMEEERHLIDILRRGRGTLVPIASGIGQRHDHLNPGQRAAVLHILTSPDSFTAVLGVAGSGKSTLISAAKREIEAAGLRAIVVAPTASAARITLRDDGIHDAETLQRLLCDRRMQQTAQGQIVLLDEASLAGTQDLLKLARLSEQQQFRVVMLGDGRQLKSVARGDVLAVAQNLGGVRSACVTEILRQQDEAKAIVELLAGDRAADAFDRLAAMGAVRTEGHDALAREYIAELKRGHRVCAIAPTHGEVRAVTGHIRTALRTDGVLEAEEREFPRLVDLQLTDAERRDVASYMPGLVAQFRHAKGPFRNGEQVEVTDSNRPMLQEHAAAHQLYRRDTLPVSVGDRLRITRGGKTPCGWRLDNGATFRVSGFTESGDIELSNGTQLSRTYSHIAHDWATTVFASQSRTVDTVLIAAGFQSLPAMSTATLYVAVSRARRRALIYTDCPRELRQAARKPRTKFTATFDRARPSLIAAALRTAAERLRLLRQRARSKQTARGPALIGYKSR